MAIEGNDPEQWRREYNDGMAFMMAFDTLGVRDDAPTAFILTALLLYRERGFSWEQVRSLVDRTVSDPKTANAVQANVFARERFARERRGGA